MARTINAEHVRRTDMFYVPPDQVFVDHKENTRLYKPDVSGMITSLKLNGQWQPVVVRPLPQGLIQLVAGYRRWMAAMEIIKEQAEAGVPYEDRFKIACTLQKIGPSDALIANIGENADRESLSPIENAVAIKRLRDLRGWHDAEGTEKIAAIFKKSIAWVNETEDLLTLSEEHRFAVHTHFVTNGHAGIKLAVAHILKNIPEDKRNKILEDAAAASVTGKNNTPTGKKKTASEPAVDPSSEPASPPAEPASPPAKPSTANIKVRDIATAAQKNGVAVSRARDRKEFTDFLDGYFDGSEALHPFHPVMVELLKRIRGFFDREFTEVQIDNTLCKIDACLAQHYAETKPARRSAGR